MIQINKSTDRRRIWEEAPILVAHQPELFPWLGNISKETMGDVYFILDSVQYMKSHWHNRNRIKSKNGIQWLTIPVLGTKKTLMNYQDVEIDNNAPWKRKHLQAIKQAYSKALCFKYWFKDIEKLYEFEDKYLIDFVERTMKFAYKVFGAEIPIYRTSKLIEMGYDISGTKTDLILKMCEVVGAKTFVFGQDGKKYIERDKFDKAGVKYTFQVFKHPIYPQPGEFVSHLSFLDMLFNGGQLKGSKNE